MSNKEFKRRKLASQVFKKAWALFKKGARWSYSFANCLKLAWATLRGISEFKFSKAKGVSFANSNGVSRQQVIMALRKYDYSQISLFFEREPLNQFDSDAIKVLAKVENRGVAQIGFVAKEIAADIALKLDYGYEAIVILEQITGTTLGSLGVNFSYVLLI